MNNEKEIVTSNKTGKVNFTNKWGVTLSELTIRHRRSNDPSKEESVTVSAVANNETLNNVLSFTYTTGVGSPYDYWWIKFSTLTGNEYKIKDDFYCYVSSSDDGNVKMELQGDSNNLRVDFSSSSGCDVSVKPVNKLSDTSDEVEMEQLAIFIDQLIALDEKYTCKEADSIMGRYVRETIHNNSMFENFTKRFK